LVIADRCRPGCDRGFAARAFAIRAAGSSTGGRSVDDITTVSDMVPSASPGLAKKRL
jgi:hypothetical protein